MGILEEIRADKKRMILRNGESIFEMNIYCPYCGDAQHGEVWENFDLEPCGESKEGKCQYCERHFFYKVDLCFSTRKGK